MPSDSKKIWIQTVIINNSVEQIRRLVGNVCHASSILMKKNNRFSVTYCLMGTMDKSFISSDDLEHLKVIAENYNCIFEYQSVNKITGLAELYNEGLTNINADYIFVLDENILLEPACLYRMVEKIESDSSIAVIEARRTPFEYPKEYDESTGETDYVTMVCSLIRASVFEKLQGFDDKCFSISMFDVDFSWRARLEGWKLLYHPSAIAFMNSINENCKEVNRFSDYEYYSTLDKLLLYHKWSANNQVDEIKRSIANKENRYSEKAYEQYKKKIEIDDIPKPIDDDHKVSRFYNNAMSLMRY